VCLSAAALTQRRTRSDTVLHAVMQARCRPAPVVHAQTSPSCGTGLTLRTLQRQSRTVAGPVTRSVAGQLGRCSAGLPLPEAAPETGHRTAQAATMMDAIANDAPAASLDDESGRSITSAARLPRQLVPLSPALEPGRAVASVVRLQSPDTFPVVALTVD
jgi:hypothetical protein